MTPFGWGFLTGLAFAAVIYRVACWLADAKIAARRSKVEWL